MTIRKFALRPFAPEDLIAARSVTPAVMELLSMCVRARMNIVVCGGTGSGKTTLLNVLSSFVPPSERLITIEDAAELRLSQPHVISLEARPPNVEGHGEVTVRALVRNALRMRPDRIIVGEVRGGEALDMLQAMNTGHEGSMSTTHANTIPVHTSRRMRAAACHPIFAIRTGQRREAVARVPLFSAPNRGSARTSDSRLCILLSATQIGASQGI